MKANTMNRATLPVLAILLGGMASMPLHAIERTATAREVHSVSPEIQINTQSALLSSAMSSFNKKMEALLRCNNRNMFFKPQDTTADADGCVGATIKTVSEDHNVTLPSVYFTSYPGMVTSSKGSSGTSTQYIDIRPLIANGAAAVSLLVDLNGFATNHRCNYATSGTKSINIANVNTAYGASQIHCHYDKSPNRSTTFTWSYGGSGLITVQATMGQVKPAMSASLGNIRASYTATKYVLSVGDGK